MNGYDAIMQGRHGLRNTTQPSDMEYGLLSVYSFRENDKRGEKERTDIEGEKEGKRKREKPDMSCIAHAYRDLSVGCENFCGYPYRSTREMTSRCTLRAMKNARFS